ncbi:MAG TPA: VWA domain-containing protein [Anaerolineaceae bacterium]
MARLNRHVMNNFCLLIILITILFISTPAAFGQTPAPMPDLDLILIIDNSGSMYEVSDKIDPTPNGHPGWRVVLAEMVADFLAVDQSGATHQLGAVLFGNDVKSNDGKLDYVSKLALIKEPANLSAFKSHIRKYNYNLGWTNIPAALDAAASEMQARGRTGTNVKKAIIFVSDGKYELHADMKREEIEAGHAKVRDIVAKKLVPAGIPVFTIALSEESFRKDQQNLIYKNLWDEIATTTGGTYYEPQKTGRELKDVFYAIIEKLRGKADGESKRDVKVPTTVEFRLPEGLFQVIFTVIKDNKDIRVTLSRPDQSIVKISDKGVSISASGQTESYSILSPAGGTWKVKLDGYGLVDVNYFPFEKKGFKVDWSKPNSPHPAGKPMIVEFQVLDLDLKIQKPAEIKLMIKYPDGSEKESPLVSSGTGFTATVDTPQDGKYTLTALGKQDGGNIFGEKEISVLKAPWMRIDAPAPDKEYPLNQPLAVKIQVMFGSAPISQYDPTDSIEGDVSLYTDKNERLSLSGLNKQAGGILDAQLDPKQKGTFQLRAKMTIKKSSGESFSDQADMFVKVGEAITPTATISPTVTRTPAPVITQTPSLTPTITITPTPKPTVSPIVAAAGGVGCLLLLVVLLIAGGGGYWWFSKPALIGTMEVGGQLYPLNGKRTISVGSAPGSKIPVNGNGVMPKHATLKPIGSRKSPRVEIRAVYSNYPIRVNGLETSYQILQDGDKIEIGDQVIHYSGPAVLDFDNTMDSGSSNSTTFSF